MNNRAFLILLLIYLLFSKGLFAQEVTRDDISACFSIVLESDWYRPYLVRNNVPGTQDTCIILINGNGVDLNSLDSYLSDCAVYFGLAEIVFYYDTPIYNLVGDFELRNDTLILDVHNGTWGKVDNFKYGRFKCVFTRKDRHWKLYWYEKL